MFVHLTVDTEFSAGGVWRDKSRAPVTDANVWCDVDGESQGLGFMLAELKRSGLTATFFVEAVHIDMLGEEAMRPAVEAIMADGHGVELHAHPMWLAGADGWDEKNPPHDDCADCSPEDLARMIAIGRRAFASWGAPPPTAFRAGGLSAGEGVYRALADAGIGVASNVGLGVKAPREHRLRRSTGRLLVEGVVEAPVTSFRAIDPRPGASVRLAAVRGAGFGELTAVIEAAAANGVEDFIILAHPFDFVLADDPELKGIRINHAVQRRFSRLCAWLAARRDRFPTTTFAERAPHWTAAPEAPDVALRAPAPASLKRMAESAIEGPDRR